MRDSRPLESLVQMSTAGESEVRFPSIPAHTAQRQNRSPGPSVPILHLFYYTKLPPLVYPVLILLRRRLGRLHRDGDI